MFASASGWGLFCRCPFRDEDATVVLIGMRVAERLWGRVDGWVITAAPADALALRRAG